MHRIAGCRRRLAVAENPVQFDEESATPTAAPAPGEGSDELFLELGLSMDDIIAHNVSDAVL